MEVTSLTNKDSHVVVGGSNVQSFGLSDNAEFFSMLSEGIYTDKPLAVVREVLCNSWDAHIASNIKDTPVKVTVEDNQMIFQDFGTGISPENIVPIYCIYGDSTKKSDTNLTGGFGLGSKAPFAYADYFTVASCFAGTKSVYNLSKGSIETGNRPDIRTIVEVPTDSTGITVTIPLNTDDKYKFIQLIKRIAYFGDMNVELNGKILDTLGLDKATDDVTLTEKFDIHDDKICIRYGAVLYPVPRDSSYADNYDEIIKLIPWGSSIIFNTKPNTIAVTPSRESLSLVPICIDTITKLLDNFISVNVNFQSTLINNLFYLNYENKTKRELYVAIQRGLEFSYYEKDFIPDGIESIIQHMHCVKQEYPNLKLINIADKKLEHLKLADPINIDFYNKLETNFHNAVCSRPTLKTEWGCLVLKELENMLGTDKQYLRYAEHINQSNPLKRITSEYLRSCNFNSIVVTKSIKIAIEETRKDAIGYNNAAFAIICPRKKGDAERIVAKLAASGLDYIDATHKVTQSTRNYVKKVPRQKGMLKLSDCLSSSGSYIYGNFQENTAQRTTVKAEVFIQANDESGLEGFAYEDLTYISKLFPNACVVASKITYDKLIKLGYIDGKTALTNWLLSYARTRKFAKYHFQQGDSKPTGALGELLTIANKSTELAKLIKFKKTKDKRLIYFYKMYSDNFSYKLYNQIIIDIKDYLNKHRDEFYLFNNLSNLDLLSVFDLEYIVDRLDLKTNIQKKRIKILIQTIK
ncbi:MAG: hypothetical protein COA63_014230 [Methylophaga sp.]|nr:hypothetical protein [Methylophaga sp.]